VFTKPVADLRQGEVRRLGHQLQQPIAVPLKRRRAPITALWSRRHRSALSPGLCQLDDKARTDREHGGYPAHAAARLNLSNHPLAKVYRIGSRHPLPPKCGDILAYFDHILEVSIPSDRQPV
jgi:hypothetical protein